MGKNQWKYDIDSSGETITFHNQVQHKHCKLQATMKSILHLPMGPSRYHVITEQGGEVRPHDHIVYNSDHAT